MKLSRPVVVQCCGHLPIFLIWAWFNFELQFLDYMYIEKGRNRIIHSNIFLPITVGGANTGKFAIMMQSNPR